MGSPIDQGPFQHMLADSNRVAFDTGSVLSSVISVLFAGFLPFAAVAALIRLPMLLARLSVAGPTPPAPLAQLLLQLGDLVFNYFTAAALVYGVFQTLRGRPATIGECIAQGLRRLLPALGVALVVGVLTFLGALLLCIPGLMVMCAYYVAVPTCVVERAGVATALRRSAQLTHGYRWSVFAIAIGVGVLGFLLVALVGAAALAVSIGPTTVIALEWILTVASELLGAVAMSVIYFRLRQIKESVSDVEAIASVFD